MNFKSLVIVVLLMTAYESYAKEACSELPTHAELTAALKASVTLSASQPLPGISTNGGFETNMWAAIVDRDGVVCAISRSDDHRTNQWPGSRVIAVQKATTANSFSLPQLGLSSTNLYSASQPNNWAAGLQFSNPVNPNVAYSGDPDQYGTDNDPMIGLVLGGVNVFAGGLALYNQQGEIIGALGASGDTSCADHNVAWRIRDTLALDNVNVGIPEALGATLPDNITANRDNVLYDYSTPDIAFLNPGEPGFVDQQSLTGFGHPVCLGDSDRLVNRAVVAAHPIGPTLTVVVNSFQELIIEGNSGSITAIANIPVNSYSWTQIAGPTIALAGTNSDTISFTTPKVDEDVVLTFQVVVTDGLQTTTTEANVMLKNKIDRGSGAINILAILLFSLFFFRRIK